MGNACPSLYLPCRLRLGIECMGDKSSFDSCSESERELHTTEQGLRVYNIDSIWVMAASPQQAVDCAKESDLVGASIEDDGWTADGIAPVDLDDTRMMWQPDESDEMVTYREAIRRHLAAQPNVAPCVIATEDY